MALHFFDNYAGAYGMGPSDSPVQVSLNWQSPADGTVTALRWRRGDTVAGHKPTALVLYDGTSGQVVATAPSIPDDGAVGWQEVALAAPVATFATHYYKVAANWAAGFYTQSPTPFQDVGPPYPLQWGPTKRCFHYGGSVADGGESCDTTGWYALDVAYIAGDIPPPPAATPTDVNNSLADWLSSTDNLHQTDGLPWLTKVELDAVKTQQDADHTLITQIDSKATGATGFDAIKSVADTIATAVSGLPGTIASAVTTITGQLTTMASTISGQLTSLGASLGGDITTIETHLIDALAGQTSTLLHGPPPVPATGWALVDETDWTHTLAWDVPADVYVCTITAAPGFPSNDVAGVAYLPHLGWWAPLNGTQVGTRQTFAFLENEFASPLGQLPGVLLKTHPQVTGHIQAWVFA